jgi:hypothetical protein
VSVVAAKDSPFRDARTRSRYVVFHARFEELGLPDQPLEERHGGLHADDAVLVERAVRRPIASARVSPDTMSFEIIES